MRDASESVVLRLVKALIATVATIVWWLVWLLALPSYRSVGVAAIAILLWCPLAWAAFIVDLRRSRSVRNDPPPRAVGRHAVVPAPPVRSPRRTRHAAVAHPPPVEPVTTDAIHQDR